MVGSWSGANGLLDVCDLSGIVEVHGVAAEANGEVNCKTDGDRKYECGLGSAGYLLDCVSLLGSRRLGLLDDLVLEFSGGYEGDDELDKDSGKGEEKHEVGESFGVRGCLGDQLVTAGVKLLWNGSGEIDLQAALQHTANDDQEFEN